MKKITGTIVKIIDNKAAIMTKGCEMIYIKKQPGMYLGLEIQFGSNEIISNKNKANMAIKIVLPVAAIFILVFLNQHLFHDSNNYTYVCIDGEFSVEYTLDKDMKVVDATSNDKKSQEDLMKIDFKSKPLQDALSAMLKDNKNFSQNGAVGSDCIIISAYTKNKNDDKNYAIKNTEKVLLACKNSVDELDNEVEYRFVEINDEARNLAEENNISMGRYYVFEKAQEQGKSISLEQAKDMQVADLIDKVSIPCLSISDKTTNSEKKTVKPDNTENKNLPTDIASMNTHTEKEPKKQKTHNKKDPIDFKIEENNINKDKKSSDDKKNIPIVLETPPTPNAMEKNESIVTSAPTLDTNDKKESPTPIMPQANDKKQPPAPIEPQVNDKKEMPTPIVPKTSNKKEPPAHIKPKEDNKKGLHTPIAPKDNEKKVPKNNDEKDPPTPIESKTIDEKDAPAPIAQKTNDKKEPLTPIEFKANDKKEPTTPVDPKTNPIEPKADNKKEPLVLPMTTD